MLRVREKTSQRLNVLLFDRDQDPVTPTTLRYRIDTITGSEVLGWTSLTPSTEVEITLTPAQNTVQDRSKVIERRVVTFEADADLSTAFTYDYEYELKRLEGF